MLPTRAAELMANREKSRRRELLRIIENLLNMETEGQIADGESHTHE
jgi:hypothetical protein